MGGDPMRKTATPLAAAGFALHWLKARQKSPVNEGWPSAPVPTLAELMAAWRPGYNLGLRPGKWSKVAGCYAHWIDLDIRNPALAAEAKAALTALLPEYKHLPSIISGSGGDSRHFVIFTDRPFNSRKLARSKTKNLGPDGKWHHDWEIELFGTGKQVAIPPSIHPITGKPYRWERPLDLAMLTIAADLGQAPFIPSERIAAWEGVSGTDDHNQQKPGGDEGELLKVVRYRPLDLSEDKIDDILARLPSEWCDDRDLWLKVGMALHHQYKCSDAGFERWCSWSQRSDKYDPEDQERVWASVRGKRDPVTFRTLIGTVNKAKEAEVNDILAEVANTIDPAADECEDPASLPRRNWYFGWHYIGGYVSATIAPGGLGKSSNAIVEAYSMATGRPLLGGQDVPRRGPLRVWYINLEDPLNELKLRMAAVRLHYAINKVDVGRRLFRNGRELELCIAVETRTGITILQPVVEAMQAAIRRLQIDVLIIDPFVSSHAVSENDNMKIDRVVKTWARIADETGCAIDLVHHAKKPRPGQMEYTADDSRGASALVNATRSTRVLNRMSEKEAEQLGIDNRRLYFRIDNDKANLAPPADKAVWRRLVSVGIGNGSDWTQSDQDRVGVVEPWSPPDPRGELTEADVNAVLEAVRDGEWRESSRAKGWVGYAFEKALDWDLGVPETRRLVVRLVTSWLAEGVLCTEKRRDPKRRDQRTFVVIGAASAEMFSSTEN